MRGAAPILEQVAPTADPARALDIELATRLVDERVGAVGEVDESGDQSRIVDVVLVPIVLMARLLAAPIDPLLTILVEVAL
jgi:hypothetical protein